MHFRQFDPSEDIKGDHGYQYQKKDEEFDIPCLIPVGYLFLWICAGDDIGDLIGVSKDDFLGVVTMVKVF
jgi:hypothetical protein